MDNQQPQYNVNDLITELANRNTQLTVENAELRAIIKQLQNQEATQSE